jgi:hypothetical protein
VKNFLYLNASKFLRHHTNMYQLLPLKKGTYVLFINCFDLTAISKFVRRKKNSPLRHMFALASYKSEEEVSRI